MAYQALGQALKDRTRFTEAAHVLHTVATQLNPRSAQAYWALGKVHALTVDEFDSDPDDPADPSHYYELASRLQPAQYRLDGTRVKWVEPMTPEREIKLQKEAKDKREKLISDLQQGKRSLNYAGDARTGA